MTQYLTISRIIGGGTAGLTIAVRLTENPQASVLVLEAGNDHSNDINVLAPGLFTAMYSNTEYDWNYKSVPQVDGINFQIEVLYCQSRKYTQTTKL